MEKMTMKEWQEYRQAMLANGSCAVCALRDECFALKSLRAVAAFLDRRFTEMALVPQATA